jgi:hypothetical protein
MNLQQLLNVQYPVRCAAAVERIITNCPTTISVLGEHVRDLLCEISANDYEVATDPQSLVHGPFPIENYFTGDAVQATVRLDPAGQTLLVEEYRIHTIPSVNKIHLRLGNYELEAHPALARKLQSCDSVRDNLLAAVEEFERDLAVNPLRDVSDLVCLEDYRAGETIAVVLSQHGDQVVADLVAD